MAETYDWDSLKAETLSRLGLASLFSQLGYSLARTDGRWQRCPRCGKDAKFNIKEDKRFSCYNPSCDFHYDNLSALKLKNDAIGLMAVTEGVTWQHASYRCMLLAGTLTQEQYDSLTDPAKREKRKRNRKKKPPTPAETPPTSDESAEPDNVVPFAEPKAAEEKKPLRTAEPTPEEDTIPGLSAPAPSEDDDKPAPEAWQKLWERLPLLDGDRTRLIEERGLSREMVEKCGYRSSRAANFNLIEKLRREIDDDESLIEYGILRSDSRGIRPEPQICGSGNTGQRDEQGHPIFAPDANPILIPYFNIHGEVITMRAHKGGLPKRLLPGEIETTNYSHPYGEHFLRQHRGTRFCVITEGELKAAACAQQGIPTLAIPGITFINNPIFRAELLALLSRHQIDEVVIIFDNEEKGDPALPTFIQNPNKRYDVVIWANVIAFHLRKAGIRSVRIGQLPDRCRDKKGKADFDGILIDCIRQHGVEAGNRAAEQIFRDTIEAATTGREMVETLFPSRAQQIIHSAVIRKTTDRLMEVGGDEEVRKGFLFRSLNSTLGEALADTEHCYFTRKNPDAKKRQEIADRRAVLQEKLDAARENRAKPYLIRNLNLRIAVLDEMMKGWPDRISSFKLRCIYRVKTEEGGEVDYYCEAYDRRERRRTRFRIPAKKLASAREFRELTLARFSSTFRGGDRDLEKITEDLGTDSSFRLVEEVNAYGYHKPSGLWFCGDAAYAPDGEMIRPDEDSVFWYKDQGYQIDSEPDHIGLGFQHGAPMMTPDDPEPDGLFDNFAHFLNDFCDTIGGLEGWAILGTAFAYFAMPSFMARYRNQHPGIWLHGTYGDGKTYVAKWLMRLFGFPSSFMEVRLSPDTTLVAIGRVLAQYSCIPVFFDEYRTEYTKPELDAALRGAFDRSSAAKGRIDNMTRTRTTTPRTTPIVCGESECADPATRSRYVQAIISKRRRKPDPHNQRFQRLDQFSDSLRFIGRRILSERGQFDKFFLARYQEWETDLETNPIGEAVNKRAILSYGVAYAGLTAAIDLLGCDADPGQLRAWNPFLRRYMDTADQDTRAGGVIDQFWEMFLAAIRAGYVPASNLKVLYCLRNGDGLHIDTENAPGAFAVVAINAVDAFAKYEEWLRRQGKESRLSRRNLAKYLANENYWAWRDSSQRWRVRFDGRLCTAWGILLEEFPFRDELESVLPDESPLDSQDDA